MKIAICYESYLGQTEKVAGALREHVERTGNTVSLMRCRDRESSEKIRQADAVLVGSPIRAGKLHKKVIAFGKKNVDLLQKKKTGLFLVCLSAKDTTPESAAEIQKYLAQFVELTGLTPSIQRAFGGSLVYTRYNFVLRFIMKKINQKYGGDTDTSRDYEYTDWDAVRKFADEFSGAPG